VYVFFNFKGVRANGQRRFDNFRSVVKSQGYNINAIKLNRVRVQCLQLWTRVVKIRRRCQIWRF